MAGSNSGGSGSFYSGLPRMQADNASNSSVASSFAALRNRPIQPIIEDKDWYGDDPQGFHQRFAVGPYYLPGEPRTGYPGGPPSNASSSMAVAIDQSQYSLSLYPPSLAGCSEATGSSERSLRTSSGASALSRYQRPGRLEEGDDGIPVRSNATTWQCPYGFLLCNEWLDSMEDWEHHCRSHFRGPEGLPKHAECPFFGCQWFVEAATGIEAWTHRWLHIRRCHSAGGRMDASRPPGRRLVEHLWRIGVISEAQKKKLRTNGSLSGPDVYLESANSSRDRRRERPRGGGRDPRG